VRWGGVKNLGLTLTLNPGVFFVLSSDTTILFRYLL
jgi:hypothetical protein